MTIASETIPVSTGTNASSADFPVRWPKPSDAKLFWQYRPDHFPYRIKPLVANGYYYMAFAPPDLPPGVTNGHHPINMADVEARYMSVAKFTATLSPL